MKRKLEKPLIQWKQQIWDALGGNNPVGYYDPSRYASKNPNVCKGGSKKKQQHNTKVGNEATESLSRRAAFRKAKRDACIPNSAQHKKPVYVHDSRYENRWVYEFDEYTEEGYQKFIVEHREDKFGRGPHFHGADSGGDVSPLEKGRYNQYDGHYPENFDGYKKP